jgi:hypothetical protein
MIMAPRTPLEPSVASFESTIHPRLSDWSAHRYDACNFFEGLKRYRNVEMYLYDGP